MTIQTHDKINELKPRLTSQHGQNNRKGVSWAGVVKFMVGVFFILSLTVNCIGQFPFANPFGGKSTTHSSAGSTLDLPPIFKAAQQCNGVQFAELLKQDISSVNKTLDAATGYRFERESGYPGHNDAGIGQFKNFTLLDFAAENGCTNIIQQLLDLNADINTFIPPISLAAANGHLDAVRLLLKAGAKPDDGLIAACDNGQADVAEALINAGANGVQERYRGKDLLANAVEKGNLEIVQVLLTMPKDPGDTYKYGYTRRHAFRTAIQKGNLDIVKAFVAAGEDVSDSRDNDDRANMQDTLEQVAVEANQPEILAYLKEEKQDQTAAIAQKDTAQAQQEAVAEKEQQAQDAAASEALDKKLQDSLDHPDDVFGLADSRYREFNGKVYDCAEPIEFLNKLNAYYAILNQNPNQQDFLKKAASSLEANPWFKVADDCSIFPVLVQHVTTDGLIVRLNSSVDEEVLVFLKNHPKQKVYVDGDLMGAHLFVMKTDRYQYTDALGTLHTIRAYDFGKVVSPPSGTVEKLPLPDAEP